VIDTGAPVSTQPTGDENAADRREIEAIYARLLDHINVARGSVQVIKRKDRISTASQKVVNTWSQELKEITRNKRGSRISLANTGDAGSFAVTSASSIQPQPIGFWHSHPSYFLISAQTKLWFTSPIASKHRRLR
jgi:hypothetical protein